MSQRKNLEELRDTARDLGRCIDYLLQGQTQLVLATCQAIEGQATLVLDAMSRLGLLDCWEPGDGIVIEAEGSDVTQAELGALLEGRTLGPLPPGIELRKLDLVQQWAEAANAPAELPDADPAAPGIEPPAGTPPQDLGLVRAQAFDALVHPAAGGVG